MASSIDPSKQPQFDPSPSPVANQEFLMDIVARVRSPCPPGISVDTEAVGALEDMNAIPRHSPLNQSVSYTEGSPKPSGETF